MKTGKTILAIKPGTRIKLSVQLDGKWHDLVDLGRSKFEIVETEEGDFVESDEPSTTGHLFEYEIDFFGWRDDKNVTRKGE